MQWQQASLALPSARQGVLGRAVEAGEEGEEAGLRRRSRDQPRRSVRADGAGRGDGGAIVFQRARQSGGGRRGAGAAGRVSCAGAGAVGEKMVLGVMTMAASAT